MTTNKSHFFSIDLTAGNWRWWFAIAAYILSIILLLFSLDHHISMWLILVMPILLLWLLNRKSPDTSINAQILVQDAGFGWGKSIKNIVWTLLAVVVFTLLVHVFEQQDKNAKDASKLVMQSLGFGKVYGKDLMLLLSIGIFAPLNEELLFRGLIFRSLFNGFIQQKYIANSTSVHTKKWLAFVLALVVSVFLFASAHGGGGQDVQMLMLMLMAVFACWLYAVTGSLIAPIMFHSINNAIALWQSKSAGHMEFAQGIISLEVVIWLLPLLTLVIVLFMRWLVVLLGKKLF